MSDPVDAPFIRPALAVLFLFGDPVAVRHAQCPACGAPVLEVEPLDLDQLRDVGLSYWSEAHIKAGRGEQPHGRPHACPDRPRVVESH